MDGWLLLVADKSLKAWSQRNIRGRGLMIADGVGQLDGEQPMCS